MTSSLPVLVLNGPNLNLLGQRQPEFYGRDTLDDVVSRCVAAAEKFGAMVEAKQSNHEGQLIDWIHEARGNVAGIVINPGGYSHTSIALRDALVTLDAPVVEVHISNIHGREEFRHHSYVSGIADAVICGLGIDGYSAAVEFVCFREGKN
ncbi:type II 3-dehydroquinate dehydratase [Rhodococcus sp. D-46]|uniref:type II 3-dehydroquinate dehydratase n=1 Tax=Rhodococcus TaxID=1827 RepID=UPI0013F5A504|nr:type II 3-dehydroquinate dehydratase [Rhodococcus qingshengii]MCQ4150133.1 type II 3-dehydroquinate dehydratase [Rhodococcus qingshengii]NHE65675.1 type II 3-dehydroquinate dehydratase [Rhodococcus sp. D-46]